MAIVIGAVAGLLAWLWLRSPPPLKCTPVLPDTTISCHFSNEARMQRYLDRYKLNELPLVGTYVNINDKPLTLAFRTKFRYLKEVDNVGLDMGGWLHSLDHVHTKYILKMHDKRDEYKLDKGLRFLLTSPKAFQVYVSPSTHHKLKNWKYHFYWMTKLMKVMNLQGPIEHFSSGGIFLMETQRAQELKNYLRDIPLSRPGQFDPSWFHMYYGEKLKQIETVNPPEIGLVTDEFLGEFEKRMQEEYQKMQKNGELVFANGIDKITFDGKALCHNGSAVRDAMVEHGLERLIWQMIKRK